MPSLSLSSIICKKTDSTFLIDLGAKTGLALGKSLPNGHCSYYYYYYLAPSILCVYLDAGRHLGEGRLHECYPGISSVQGCDSPRLQSNLLTSEFRGQLRLKGLWS